MRSVGGLTVSTLSNEKGLFFVSSSDCQPQDEMRRSFLVIFFISKLSAPDFENLMCPLSLDGLEGMNGGPGSKHNPARRLRVDFVENEDAVSRCETTFWGKPNEH